MVMKKRKYSNGDLLETSDALWVVKEKIRPNQRLNPGWKKIGPVYYGPNSEIHIEVCGYMSGDYHQLDATRITRWWKLQERIDR